jgi:hypothetical protein
MASNLKDFTVIYEKGGYAIALVKKGFKLFMKDEEKSSKGHDVYSQEDEMSFESFFELWQRDMQGGDQHDG